MKLFLILAVNALFALLASASPTAASVQEVGISPRSAPAELVDWPQSAAARGIRRGDELTNAELLQRGMTPSRPRQLYDVQPKGDIEKRYIGAPSSGVGPRKRYFYQGCANEYNSDMGSRVTSLAFTSPQDLADKCAAQTDATTVGSLRGFIIANRATSNCYSAVTSVDSPVCNAANGAYYT